MQLHRNCAIPMESTNRDIQVSTVPGTVTLGQQGHQVNNVSCNQSMEVIICNGEGTEMFAESFNIVIKLYLL